MYIYIYIYSLHFGMQVAPPNKVITHTSAHNQVRRTSKKGMPVVNADSMCTVAKLRIITSAPGPSNEKSSLG